MTLQLIIQIMQPGNQALLKNIIREMIADEELSYDLEGKLKLS
eukprot:gene19597-24013_t